MEEWKVITEFPLYSVSNLGNVKHNKTQKLRKLSLDSSGYISLTLMKENDKTSYPIKVHRLVAQSFLDNPENKQTVNHKNRIRHDNRLENLEWYTMNEQNKHKKSIPLTTGGKKVLQYDLNMKYIQTFNSIREAGRFIGTDGSSISQVCIGNYKTAYGFIWKHIEYDIIENEIWKKINIDDFIFNVSNYGRVKSQKHIISYGTKEDNGYKRVSITNNTIIKKILIHRLVALTFLDNPNDYPLVNHKDGNKENNHVNNLEWVSHSQNAQHAVNILKVGGQRKVAQFDKDTLEIIKEYQNITIAAKETNTNNTSITHVCNGRFKTANGFIWKYI